MKRVLPIALLLLAGACARSNRHLLDELEREAAAAPRPDADALLDRGDWSQPVSGAVRSITLPMEEGALPIVLGTVNGVELPLILDTGASLVALSGRAARETSLYLPEGEELEAVSPGYNPGYRRGVSDRIEIDGLGFGPGVVGIPAREAAGHAPGGLQTKSWAIVGCPVLGHFVVTFDFARREIRLVPHRNPEATGPLFVEVSINSGSYWLLVDSGASRTYLEPWAAFELGLISNGRRKRHDTKSSAFGLGKVTTIRIESLRVAGVGFDDVKAGVVNTFGDATLRDGRRPAGLLGLAGLGDRTWTVDFARRQLLTDQP